MAKDSITTLAKRLEPLLLKNAQGVVDNNPPLEGPGIDIVGFQVGLGGDTILLYKSNGDPVAEYAATGAGLDSALTAAASGNIICIPACTISGNHTIPAGVEIIGAGKDITILQGNITLSNGAFLEYLTIPGAVISPDEVTGEIRHCHVYNASGAAVQVASGGSIDIHQSIIQGKTYAISNSGTARIFHSGVWGETDWFEGTVNTYCITEILPKSTEIPIDPDFTDDFVRSAWGLDSYSPSTARYVGMCDRYGMQNTVLNLPSSISEPAALSDVGFSHAGVTSSPTYMFLTQTKGSPTNYYNALRINLSTNGSNTVDYSAGDSDVWQSASSLCPYTDDIGFIVVGYSNSDKWFTLNKVDFLSSTSTIKITFPIDGTGFGDQSSCLSMHWVPGVSGWRLVYPYLRWHLDGDGDPDYATDVDWYIYDPETETVVDIVTHTFATPFLYGDGYNIISNSVLMGNKLVTFLSRDAWDEQTIAEVHCLDLVSNTITVTSIDTTNKWGFVAWGSAPSASESAVYCTCTYYDPGYDHWYKSSYKYIPSSNSLSIARTTADFENTGNHNILADSQYAYVLESTDGINQSLIRLSDSSTILTTAVTRSACPTIDEDRHGLVTANASSATVTIYYDDSSTKTITIGTAAGSSKCLYLHRERLIVLDVNSSTRSYYIVT